MAVFQQIPGVLDLKICQGDEVNFTVVFNGLNLTGYTFSSQVYVVKQTVPLGGGASAPTAGQTAAVLSITQANLSAGTLVLGLNETQTAALSPVGSYRWFLSVVAPGEITRTMLGGAVTVVSK